MSGKRLSIEPTIDPSAIVEGARLGAWTEVGARSKVVDTVMEDYSYVVNDSEIIYAAIGKFVNIAAHVRINPGQHPMERASQHHFQYRSAAYELGEDDERFFEWRQTFPVKIGHDVWVGHGVVIKGGVSIGTGAVIGSGAVVTKDVAPYSIVAGVPAKQLRKRFPEDLQEALLRVSWWNWNHTELAERMDDFRNLEVRAFCLKYDPAMPAGIAAV